RVLFVLAEHGDAPQWLVQLNTRRVPTRSVWMGSLAGVLGILAAITSPQTVFAFLVNASGALSVFVYIIIAAAHIRLRREREARGAPEPALSMWLNTERAPEALTRNANTVCGEVMAARIP